MILRRRLVLIVVLVAACGGADDGAGDTVASGDLASTTTAATTTSEENPVTSTVGDAATTPPVAPDECAHVVEGEVSWQGDTATVSATVKSADTGWDKYADAWEVRTLEGTVLGVRELAHPHENEQPFTRTLTGVAIPAGTTDVELAARDSVVGWCGDTLMVSVPEQS